MMGWACAIQLRQSVERSFEIEVNPFYHQQTLPVSLLYLAMSSPFSTSTLSPIIARNYSRVSVIRLSVVSPTHLYRFIGIVSSRILYRLLYGRLFSLDRPSQFYVQIFESQLGRLTEIPP